MLRLGLLISLFSSFSVASLPLSWMGEAIQCNTKNTKVTTRLAAGKALDVTAEYASDDAEPFYTMLDGRRADVVVESESHWILHLRDQVTGHDLLKLDLSKPLADSGYPTYSAEVYWPLNAEETHWFNASTVCSF